MRDFLYPLVPAHLALGWYGEGGTGTVTLGGNSHGHSLGHVPKFCRRRGVRDVRDQRGMPKRAAA